MANIELKIVALGDFSSVNAQIKALQTQVELLQKGVAGVGLNSQLSSQLKNIQSDFSSALMSSGNFTKSTVQLTSETEKFGKALQSGKLSLGQYFGIITGKSAEAQKAVQALAVEQVKLNNSIVQSDITKQGVYSVYTPTKINELSHATEIAAAKQNIYNLAVREGSTQLINFGKNTQWAGRQLTVGLAMPAILFGSQAVASFKAVNTELTRLQRLYGLGLTPPSQAQLDKVSGQVLDLGKNIASSMGIAQSETVKVAANFAAMGKEGQALLDITTQTQRLSKLGSLDATQATNTIVSLQNVYKVSTADLGNAVNFLSSMQKQTTMSLQDMTDAIPRVGPIMAQLGGSYKDTAVMLLAMREAGVPAAQAANALKSAFASMIAPTSAASKEFAKFGINLDSIKNAGSPVKMLMSLQSALVGIAPLAREQLIEKLFGKFQFARVSALLDNFGKVGSQTQNALKVAGATNAQLATLAGQEMAQATESTTAKWQRAIETLKADLYPIGQKILEVGTKIIDFGQKIADFFNKLPGPIKSGLGILLTLGVIAGPIIMITGLLANLMGQGMRVGYTLLGIVNGTKKWKDLMNPTSIAAKTATDVFNEGLLTNVASVDALNAALQRMITSLTEINMSQTSSVGGVLGSVEKAAAAELASGQLLLPKMATGGIVPGSGNSDSYPAMLMPGEAVIPKDAAKKHAPFITAMINGNLPGYAFGLDENGNSVDVQKGHAYSSHNDDVLKKARALLPSQTRLSTVDDVTRGAMIGMTTDLNQAVRTGARGLSSSGVATQLERYQSLTGEGGIKLDPMADLKKIAEKLGADMTTARPQLDQAYQDMITALKTGPEQMFGKKPGQMGLEEWMEAQLKPVLSNIKTQRGGDLSSALERVASTRGRQILADNTTKTGATGSTYWVDDTGNLVPFKESGLGLPQGSVSTSGGRAIGSIKKTKAGKTLVNDIKMEAQAEAGIKSPAKVFQEEVGIPLAQGTLNGVEEGLSGSTGTSRIQGIFSKAFGANSKIGGMMSKFSGMGMMGKMGVGMGLGAVTQMASPLIDKLPGGGLISEAMSGASMGAGFGPWGMAAGAALSLVSGGIKSLMAQEKLHKQESEADFKVSSDAIQFMGLQLKSIDPVMTSFTRDVLTATGQVSQLGGSVAGKGLTYTNDQLGQFKKLITQLPKDNTLSLVMQQLKSTSDSNAAKNIAQEFVAMQMAVQGMPKDKAQQLLQLMLTASGHSGLAETANAPVNQIKAIGQSISSVYGDATKLNGLLGQIIGTNISTNNWLDFKNVLDAIGLSAAGAQGIVAGLVSYLNSVGNGAGATAIQGLQGKGWSPQDLAAIEYAATHGVNVDTTGAIKPGQEGAIKGKTGTYVGIAPGQAESQLQDPKVKAIESAWAIKQQTASVSGLTDAQTAQTAAISSNVKGWTAQKKAIDATIKSLELLQQTANKTNTYNSTKEDLKNQIIMAQATGDNLKVQQLQQQLLGTTSDYNLQNQIDAKKTQSDALGQKIADANASAQLIATQATTAAVKAGADQVTAAVAAAAKAGDINVPAGIGQAPDLTSKYGTAKGQSSGGYTGQWTASKQGVDATGQKETNSDGSPKMEKVLTAQGIRAIVKSENFKSGATFQYDGQSYRVKSNGDATWLGAQVPAASTSQQTSKKNPLNITQTMFEAAAGVYMNKDQGIPKNQIDKAGEDKLINSIKTSPNYLYQVLQRMSSPQISDGTYLKLPWGEVYLSDWNSSRLIPQKLAKGGVAGGHISGPGSATSDSIPAMLSNGEYVIKADSVSHYGKGMFDMLNAKHLAKGGVARTNSSITYHKQHMNRQARHFAEGGIVSSLIGNLIGGVDKSIGNGMGWLSKTALEISGVSPLMRILSGKKETNWDYLGAASLAALPLKGAGLIPKAVKPLMGLMESVDMSQGTIEAAQGLHAASASGSHHVYNINVTATSDNANEIAKVVMATLKQADQRMAMSGRKTKVGN